MTALAGPESLLPVPFEPRPLHELVALIQGMVARPCPCGGVIHALPADPFPGVSEHRATPRHQVWVRRGGLER